MWLLSIALVLVGGGLGPLFNGTIASLVATRIHSPLAWWRTHLSADVRNLMVRLWPGLLICYVLVFLLAVETTIFGQPMNLLFDTTTTYDLVLRAGNLMLLIMLLSVLAAFAYDIRTAET